MPASLKMRVILIAGGLLIGFTGIAALAWAAIAALVPHLGMAGAALLVGSVMTIGAALSVWMSVQPGVPVDEELSGLTGKAADAISDVRDDTIDALAGIPVTAMNRMVEEQPLLTLLGVAAAAYAIARAPEQSALVVDRMLGRLL